GFSYIRLDIGENIGDILEIYPPYGKFFMDWIIGDQYEAPYIDQSADIDGVANDSAWDSATLYYLKFQYMNFSSGEWYPDDVIDGKIMIFHNGADLFVFVEIDDSSEDMEDMFILVIGDNDNMFEDPDGTDLVTIGTDFYEDMILPSNQDDPIPDEAFGGFNDGDGAVSYADGKRRVEFTKPLQPGDPDGRDIDFYTGDKMFISLLIGEDSFEGPNYVNMDDTGTTGMPAIIVHPVKLLGEGEEPTGGETDTNTFALAFGFSDVLIIAAAISPVIAFAYLRRRKRI
ncbi:MAG: hypothetical protein KAS63_05500, partial [Candidatus Heimdallarchaeota archaeon]|nr:hypothetical protein [Candidatus Heimdallarchaeota archaeon]MCK4954793.1 hypothetical protein [Candidatus Heimdallarchaeota archaeon]